MFKKVVYEVTENWLEPRTFRNYGPNRKYLTKADIYHTIYDLLMEHRHKTFNFDIGVDRDKLRYTVRVDNMSVNLYHGKRLIYEESFMAPGGFEKFADWVAWKMVDDR